MKSSYLIYLLEFLLLALLPLPVLVLVYHICIPELKKLLLINIGAVFFNFCIQIFVQFFTRYELRDVVLLTHIVLGGSVAFMIPVLLMSSRQGREKSWLLIAFSPVLLGAIWDLCRFYLPRAYQKAVGFQLGVLLFLFLQSIYLIHSYFEYYKTNLETDVYRHMAYTDAMTGLKNRAAFEERILELGQNNQIYQDIYCICADINNLKQVNDTLGHGAGDELICSAAQLLKETMCGCCEIYRTGGDEFVIFVYNQPEAVVMEWCERLNIGRECRDKINKPMLSIALGYDRLQPGDGDTISKLVSRADALMYENKNQWKEEHGQER